MAESKPDPSSNSFSDKKYVRAPNVFERAKEEIDAMLHTERQQQQQQQHHKLKETHGLHSDIDENTPISDVKAPNVFERANEEIEAVVLTIHPKKESKTNHGSPSNGDKSCKDAAVKTELKHENSDFLSEKVVNSPKKESGAVMHNRHHKETHGQSDDIDENTPIDAIKGPSVFERAKEEIEALVQTVRTKKESDSPDSSPRKQGGFKASIGRKLEKVCSPRGHKRD